MIAGFKLTYYREQCLISVVFFDYKSIRDWNDKNPSKHNKINPGDCFYGSESFSNIQFRTRTASKFSAIKNITHDYFNPKRRMRTLLVRSMIDWGQVDCEEGCQKCQF